MFIYLLLVKINIDGRFFSIFLDCVLELKIEAIRSHGRVWKYKGEAFVEGKRMADAQWSATIVDKNN